MSFRPTVAVSWAESVLLGNFSITFWWITAPGGNRVFFLRSKSVSPGKMVTLQEKAEARCEKCARFLVFLCFCSGEEKGWTELSLSARVPGGTAALVYDRHK